MSLADILATNQPAPVRVARPAHPKGFEPGLTFTDDGRPATAVLTTTTPLVKAEDHRNRIEMQTGLEIPADLDVLVDRLTLQNGADGTVERYWYKYKFVPRQATVADIEALIKAAKRTPSKKAAPTGDTAYVIALGDLQLGKMDGDGVEGTVQRFIRTTDLAIARLKQLRKTEAIGPIYLFHLGDCIEGFQSQGGANTHRTVLTTTEQVRLYRRLLLDQVKALAPLTDRLVVAGIPGNHDEAHRPLQTYGDSWAIDTVEQVRDALDLAGNYEHVHLHTPARDELTLTLDVQGTIIGLAHGHQWRGDAMKWWAGQAHGRQDIGDADILFAGHKHHLDLIEHKHRTFVQVPALESESTWWRHRTGQGGKPGIVTLTAANGDWDNLQVIR